MSLVELRSVEKRYGDVLALKGVSLTLAPGRIGLLGPNGAGKSTLLKSLLGLVVPEQGVVRVLDRDVARETASIRAFVGYMPEGDAVLPHMTALEYTTLAAELCGLPRTEAVARAHQVLHYAGLGEARYRKLGAFSTGMKQRARLAQALVGDPKLLLLDEPTSGLDPRGRDEMLALISDIPTRTGASVILSTHILPDVEKTCEQVIVIAGGEVLYAGALEPLVSPEKGTFEVRTKGDPAKLVVELELESCRVTKDDGTLQVRVPEGRDIKLILHAAEKSGAQLRHVAPLSSSLERAFFKTLEQAGRAAAEGAV